MGRNTIMAQLPNIPAERLKKFWFSAMRIVISGKGSVEEAKQMLDAIESIVLGRARPPASVTIGQLMFEPHGHDIVSFGYAGGDHVVTIRKLEQHRHAGNKVYQVWVGKQSLGRCRRIEDARSLAVEAYTEKLEQHQ